MSLSHARHDAAGCLLAGRYRLAHVINAGASGIVWVAVDEVLGREVAVKEVSVPTCPAQDAVHEQAMREARAAGRVDHPGVVPVYDVVHQDGRPWIVMKLVRAPSLAELIEHDGPLDPRHTARVGLQILDALRAVHALGVIHRDVKPSNVLVQDDHVLLTDFGIAAIHGEATLTPADTVLGAPSYIAPECISGEPATPASDLWALGATLYTAVEGRPPYQRESALAALAATTLCEPDAVRLAGPLAPLLNDLLRRDRQRRPTAAAVERRLRRLADRPWPQEWPEEQSSARRSVDRPRERALPAGRAPADPTAADRPPGTRSARTRTVSYAAAVVGLVVLAVGLALTPRGGQQEFSGGPGSPHPRSPAVDAPDARPVTEQTPGTIPVTTRPSVAGRPPVAPATGGGGAVAPNVTAPTTTDAPADTTAPARPSTTRPTNRPPTPPSPTEAPGAGHAAPPGISPPSRTAPVPGR